jgi:transcriptional antiterminator Rof (Rho-off)
MTSDYVPIDCDQHSVLELLAMRRTKVAGRAYDENGGECLFDPAGRQRWGQPRGRRG